MNCPSIFYWSLFMDRHILYTNSRTVSWILVKFEYRQNIYFRHQNTVNQPHKTWYDKGYNNSCSSRLLKWTWLDLMWFGHQHANHSEYQTDYYWLSSHLWFHTRLKIQNQLQNYISGWINHAWCEFHCSSQHILDLKSRLKGLLLPLVMVHLDKLHGYI